MRRLITLIFADRDKPAVMVVKPMLCFPGDLLNCFVGQALARGQRRTHSRSMAVGQAASITMRLR